MEKTVLEKQGRIDNKIIKPFKSVKEFSLEIKGCVNESKIGPSEIKKIWEYETAFIFCNFT